MSKTPWTTLDKRLTEHAVSIAWNQWATLGGTLTGATTVTALIDPEALLIGSLPLLTNEPRLERVILSWLERNSPLLSVQRLKRLRRDHPPAVQAALSRLVSSVAQRHPRYRTLVEKSTMGSAPRAERTRAHEDDAPSRAIDFPADLSANLMLRMRLALGVSVKSDVLTASIVATTPRTITDLSRRLSYTSVAVRKAVDDLERARWIRTEEGRPTRVGAPDAWHTLLGLPMPPREVAWHEYFAFISTFHAWCDSEATPTADYAMAVRVRRHLETRPLLRQEWQLGAAQEGGGDPSSSMIELIERSLLEARS